jgi:hypothetical protein
VTAFVNATQHADFVKDEEFLDDGCYFLEYFTQKPENVRVDSSQ